MTDDEVSRHVRAAGEVWTRRSAREWSLDLPMLTASGVTLTPPDEAAGRAVVAERESHRARTTDPAPAIPAPQTPR